MRTLVLALTMMTVATGCHARFKKHAPTLGEVHPEVHMVTVPNVQLGGVAGGDLVGDVVNVVQYTRSIELSRKIAERVDTQATNAQFMQGLVDFLGEGPPFGTTPEKGGHTLQIEVVDMGACLARFSCPWNQLGVKKGPENTAIWLPHGDVSGIPRP